jgi:glycosyltransferase involved in cell wall biosynthesis
MKIGVDVRPLTVPTFGIGRYTRELLQRLPGLAPQHDWYFYADRPVLATPESDQITLREFSSHHRLLSLARTQLTFAHWANRDGLDLFWSPRHHLPLLMNPSIRQLLTVHDIVWKKFPQTMRPANLFVERLLMPPSLEQATRVIAVSNSTKRDLVESLSVEESKVDVIYEAAGEILVDDPLREIAQNYFLFVGTDEPRKNLKRLVQAYRQYRSTGGAQALLIVGAKGWGSVNESAASDDGILSMGYVSDSRLNGLLKHATALLLPSLYEGFGLTLLEAMQRGVPVVTSNISAMPEVMGDAGIAVDPLDLGSISQALTRMSDPTERDLFALRCFDQVTRFSWDTAARETLQVIESMCHD